MMHIMQVRKNFIEAPFKHWELTDDKAFSALLTLPTLYTTLKRLKFMNFVLFNHCVFLTIVSHIEIKRLKAQHMVFKSDFIIYKE